MNTKRNLGIWMDHSMAHLMKLTDNSIETVTIESEESLTDTDANLAKSESRIQNKEQNHLASYFKKIGDSIQDYDDVILFGPTDARIELINQLKANHLFENIKIETIPADKMTENQRQAFVKDYFRNKAD